MAMDDYALIEITFFHIGPHVVFDTTLIVSRLHYLKRPFNALMSPLRVIIIDSHDLAP
jgi:hypothetical protein